MAASEQSLRRAVRNIAKHGDTDVLPYPLENHWFFDKEDEVVALLGELDANFENWFADYAPHCVRGLAGVGYNGFREVTQIDPIWNAYLLALVIEVGSDIESQRIEAAREIVFAYRFSPDDASYHLFNRDIGWGAFQAKALELSESSRFVLATDISDFYSRVYHHRIENALGYATTNTSVRGRIEKILRGISHGGVSFGLPVGGNAARLLAELLLNRTDRLLITKQIKFLRFVDDYYLFADSRDEVRQALVFLSQVLRSEEGLSLQRSKTRILSSEEFRRSSPVAEPEGDAETEDELRRFMSIRILYDPYSPTADEDYEKLQEDLRQYDIVGMLGRQLRKTRIDEAVTRRLIRSVEYLDADVRDAAVRSIIDNLGVLYPVFPTVAILFRALERDLSAECRRDLYDTLLGLLESDSHILQVTTNLGFAIRLLTNDQREVAEIALARLYEHAGSELIRRDVILAMAKRRAHHWLSQLLKQGAGSLWERRALIPLSYVLGDEGQHWRQRVRDTWGAVDRAFRDYVAEKNTGQLWEIPL